MKKDILNEKLDLFAFMRAIGFDEFFDHIPDTFVNEDMMLYVTPGPFFVKINDCYDHPKEVTRHCDRPKTLREAFDILYPAINPDLQLTESDKQDIIEDYQFHAHGIRFLRLK